MPGYGFKLNPKPDSINKSDQCPPEAFATNDRTELIRPHLTPMTKSF